MLLPSEEEGVLATLKPKNIPIKKLTINPEKVSAMRSGYSCRRLSSIVMKTRSVEGLSRSIVSNEPTFLSRYTSPYRNMFLEDRCSVCSAEGMW